MPTVDVVVPNVPDVDVDEQQHSAQPGAPDQSGPGASDTRHSMAYTRGNMRGQVGRLPKTSTSFAKADTKAFHTALHHASKWSLSVDEMFDAHRTIDA